MYRWLFAVKLFAIERVERVLEQIHKHLDEFILISPNGLVLGQSLFNFHFVLQFAAEETE